MIWTHLFHKQSSKTRWLFSITLLKLFPFLQHWIKAIHSSAKIHQIVKSILLSIVCNLFLSFQKICSSRHHHCQNQESFHLARYRDPITSEQPVCHSTFEKKKICRKRIDADWKEIQYFTTVCRLTKTKAPKRVKPGPGSNAVLPKRK